MFDRRGYSWVPRVAFLYNPSSTAINKGEAVKWQGASASVFQMQWPEPYGPLDARAPESRKGPVTFGVPGIVRCVRRNKYADICGVALDDIPASSWGYVVMEGPADVLIATGENVSFGDALLCSANAVFSVVSDPKAATVIHAVALEAGTGPCYVLAFLPVRPGPLDTLNFHDPDRRSLAAASTLSLPVTISGATMEWRSVSELSPGTSPLSLDFSIQSGASLEWTAYNADYYVSTTGDDANSGTAPDDAWATLQHAVDNCGTGKTIMLLSGTHTSGATAASAEITILGESGAVLDVGKTASYAIVLTGSAQTIKQLEVKGATLKAIYISSVASNALVESCEIHHCVATATAGYGVGAIGDGSQVKNCKIHHIGTVLDGETSTSGEAFGIYVGKDCNDAVVSGNQLYLCRKAPIRVAGYDATVKSNYIWACWSGIDANSQKGGLWKDNIVEYCGEGAYVKHVTASTVSAPRFEYNTIRRCWQFYYHSEGSPTAYSQQCRYNRFEADKGDHYVLVRTGEVVDATIDYNFYTVLGTSPYQMWEVDPSSNHYDNLTDVCSTWGWACNSKTAEDSTTQTWGAAGLSRTEPAWVPCTPEDVEGPASASNVSGLIDGKYEHGYFSSNGTPSSAIFDFGSSTTPSVQYVAQEGLFDNSTTNAAQVAISVSDDKSNWSTVFSCALDENRATHWFELDTVYTNRYWRLEWASAIGGDQIYVAEVHFGRLE